MLLSAYGNGNFNIYAPKIVIFEVANVLYRLWKLKLISKEYSLNAFEKLAGIPFTFIDLDSEELVKTLASSFETGVTFYDSLYITVSQKTKSALVSADDELIKKARSYAKVMHLMNYKG